jgi:hypothetical protein
MKSIPMIDGSEVQALTTERKHLSFRPGERKARQALRNEQ